MACGYDRRGSLTDLACSECGSHEFVTDPDAHRLGLAAPGSKRRRLIAAWCLLLANLAAALIFAGVAIEELEDMYGDWGIAGSFNLFRFPGFLFACVVFGGIGLAGVLAAMDRWAFSPLLLRIPLAVSAIAGPLAWGQVVYIVLGPGFWLIPVSPWLIFSAAVSGVAASYLMYCLRRAQLHQKYQPKRWSDHWPWIVAAYVVFSMGWMMIYLLDWIVGLKLHLGYGNAGLASRLFVCTGIAGLLVHLTSAYWLFAVISASRQRQSVFQEQTRPRTNAL